MLLLINTYTYAITWVAVKFGINIMSVYWKWDKIHEAKPSEITHFQYNTSGIYPKFSLLPMLFHVNTRHVTYARKFAKLLCKNCTIHKYVSALIGDIIQPMKFHLQLFYWLDTCQ